MRCWKHSFSWHPFLCAAVALQILSSSQNSIFVFGATIAKNPATKNTSKLSIRADLLTDSRDKTVSTCVLVKQYQDRRWIGKSSTSSFNGDGVMRRSRKSIRHADRLWPKAEVPYELVYPLWPGIEELLDQSFDAFHLYTCIRFRPRQWYDWYHVRIVQGIMCASYVNYAYFGTPELSLTYGCYDKRIITRLLGLVIGLIHQHNRPDRDDYVTLRFENARDSTLVEYRKFKAEEVDLYGIPYDYLSIMHFGQYVAGVDGGVSIETKNRSYQNLIGRSTGLSFRDIKLANMMYKCSAVNGCKNLICPGEGFVGKDCQCWCPSNSIDKKAEPCAEVTEVANTSCPGKGLVGQVCPCECPPGSSNETYQYGAEVTGCKNATSSKEGILGQDCQCDCSSGNSNETYRKNAEVTGCVNMSCPGKGLISQDSLCRCPPGSSNSTLEHGAEVTGCTNTTCPGERFDDQDSRLNRTAEHGAGDNRKHYSEEANGCTNITCPAKGFVGQDCRCWCPSENSNKTDEHCARDQGSVKWSIGQLAAITVGCAVSLSAIVMLLIVVVHRKRQLALKKSSSQIVDAENKVAQSSVLATEYCSLDHKPTVANYAVLDTEQPMYISLQPDTTAATYCELDLYPTLN